MAGLTNGCKISRQRINVAPHLMRDGHLEPGFFARSLREPRPDRSDVQYAQVLKQNAPAEA